jgi:hypothetical protein
VDVQCAVEGGDPLGQAAQSAAVATGIGAALAVVGHGQAEPVVATVHGDLGPAGLRVLGDVGERLGDDEVGDPARTLYESLGGGLAAQGPTVTYWFVLDR